MSRAHIITGSGRILGGLPVIVKLHCGFDSFLGEGWSDVDSIHWKKKDGKAGKRIPDSVHDRALAYDPYFADLIDQVCDDYHSRGDDND